MGKYFGTDGFRGEANVTLTADHAYKVGRFLGWYYGELKRRSGNMEPAKVVIGNSVELKNVIIFDGAEVPHFNYVGDSILGYKAHMGAGSIPSNIKSDRTLITVKTPEGAYPTGIRKIGAMLGDRAEIGCNSVLNPGTIVGRNSIVYPLSSVRGMVPANSIYKTGGVIAPKE